jgi:hypothetical protein
MWIRRGAAAGLALTSAIVFDPGIGHAGEICKRICIEGYEAFCVRAHSYQQNVTRQIDRVVLYVENAHDGTFSFASNVQTEGAPYPTKIVGFKEVKDLDTVFGNLDQGFFEQIVSNPDVLKTFHDTAEVYITPDVMKPDGSSDLDFSGVKKIHVLSKGPPSQ